MILADRMPDAEVSDSVGIPGSPTPWRSLKGMADVVGLHKVVLAFNHDSGHLSANNRIAFYRVVAGRGRVTAAPPISPNAFIARVVDVIV